MSGSVNPAKSDSISATKSLKSTTGKNIFVVPNKFVLTREHAKTISFNTRQYR